MTHRKIEERERKREFEERFLIADVAASYYYCKFKNASLIAYCAYSNA